MTLFDTSVLIAHLRGDARATELLTGVRTEERLASVLARVEIEGGMRSAEQAQVASLFSVIRRFPVTDAIAARAAEHPVATAGPIRASISSTASSRRPRSSTTPSSRRSMCVISDVQGVARGLVAAAPGDRAGPPS